MYYRFIGSKRKAADLDSIFKGSSCFLIGGGPSVDVDLLSKDGVVTMAMNNAASLFQPTLWVGADKPSNYSRSILANDAIMKFTYLSRCNEKIVSIPWKDLANTFFLGSRDTPTNEFFRKTNYFVWWKNVFMLSVQLAYRLGFNKVYTVGCGFKTDPDQPYSFESNLTKAQIEYNQRTYDMVIRQFEKIIPHMPENFEVVSCTEDSRLNDLVRHMDIDIATRSCWLAKHDTTNVSHPLKETEGVTDEDLPPKLGGHYLMAKKHREAVLSKLPENGKMLEWGSGNSTFWFRANLKESQTLTSIEHDVKWAKKTEAIHVHITVGKNATMEEEISTDFHEYISQAEKHGPFDVVLVDGVVRNLCLKEAIKNLNSGGTVFLHDANRDWYEAGKKLYETQKIYPSEPDYPGPSLWEGKP